MQFDLDKKNILSKIDKSKIGGIDEGIKELVEFINNKEDYYTTSSCAGRILLFALDESYKKNESFWIYATHNEVSFDEIKEQLKNIPQDKDTWFREESAIIHISCRTLEKASIILELFKNNGFKRSGISTISNKIIIEAIATEQMDAIIAKKGVMLIDDAYFKILIEEANKKMVRTKEKIKNIEKILKEKL